MKHSTSYFLFLCIFFLLSACCKEKKLLGTRIFSDTQKQCIPYQEQQKMRFSRSNSTDITTFTVSQISDKIEEEGCGPECCDYYQVEKVYVTLDADYPKFKFYISLDKNHMMEDKVVVNDSLLYVKLQLNQSSFSISSPEKSCGDTTIARICYDSLSFNQKTYYQVIESKAYIQDSLVKPYKIWYNKAAGILQFQFTDSTTYTLLP